MIAVHKLCKAFGGKTVLQDFSCELEEGRVTALMAPSGAGKTTLLRILLGLETADSGEITGLSGKRLAAVFQEDRLLDFMTPVDNIRLPEPKQFGQLLCLRQRFPRDRFPVPKQIDGHFL